MSPTQPNRRVWITRSAEGNRVWYPKVRKAGYTPVAFEALRFHVCHDELDSVRENLREVDWVVFSSPRGVRALASMGLEPPAAARLACIGRSTGKTCADRYRPAELFAPEQTARSLARILIQTPGWDRVALVGAREARPELHDLLAEQGYDVRICPVYATHLPLESECQLEFQSGDAILLASPSALQAITRAHPIPRDVDLISIGPTTSEAIRMAGYDVAAEAQTRDIEGLLRALRRLSPS